MVPPLRLLTLTVMTPVPPDPATTVTPAPPSCGLLFVALGAKTTPRTVIVAPPSLVTLPPKVAVVPVTPVAVGVVIVGTNTAMTLSAPVAASWEVFHALPAGNAGSVNELKLPDMVAEENNVKASPTAGV